jgi:hypothetical protein
MIYLKASYKTKAFMGLNCSQWPNQKCFFGEVICIEEIKIVELLIEFAFNLKVTRILKDILDIY